MTPETAILLSIFLPLLGGLSLRLFDAKPNLREVVSLTTAGATFLCVLSILPKVMAGERPELVLGEMLPGSVSYTHLTLPTKA